MAARRLGRQAGLNPDEILERLFSEHPDPTVSDEEFMPYDDESDRECQMEDTYPRGHQEEEEEVLLELEDNALTEVQADLAGDALGPVSDQSHLRRQNRATTSSAAAGPGQPSFSEQQPEVPSRSDPRSPVTPEQPEVPQRSTPPTPRSPYIPP